jgi:hypothetical protein
MSWGNWEARNVGRTVTEERVMVEMVSRWHIQIWSITITERNWRRRRRRRRRKMECAVLFWGV